MLTYAYETRTLASDLVLFKIVISELFLFQIQPYVETLRLDYIVEFFKHYGNIDWLEIVKYSLSEKQSILD